jgi:hypothetical protein
LLHAGYGLLLLLVSLVSTWPYLYPQNLFAPVGWFCVMLATVQGEIDWQRDRFTRRLIPAGSIVGAALCLATATASLGLSHSVVARVQAKQTRLLSLQAHDKVLLAADSHPICIHDASFFVNPITDAEDRLAVTVRRVQPRWPLPECAYLEDLLREKPALIDPFLLGVLPEVKRRALVQLLQEEYEEVSSGGDDFAVRRVLYRHKWEMRETGKEVKTEAE